MCKRPIIAIGPRDKESVKYGVLVTQTFLTRWLLLSLNKLFNDTKTKSILQRATTARKFISVSRH